MAVTEEIAWGDGSGDKIYLTANALEGNQTVLVSSDANTGAARTKTVTFTAGLITQSLTINQEAGSSEQTLTVHPSKWDQVNSSYASFTNDASYGFDDTSNAVNAGINLVTGAQSETFFYYGFDLSSIPVGATIVSVEMDVKASISTTNTNYVALKSLFVCNGITPVGTEQAITGTATICEMDCGSGWTRSSLQNIQICAYAKRGSSRPNNTYRLNFYGADLTVKYTV